MIRLLFPFLLLVVVSRGEEKSAPQAADEAGLEAILGFEAEPTGDKPRDWNGGPQETIFLGRTVKHSGNAAARIERTAASPERFTSITKALPVAFAGQRVELRGFLRSEAVSEYFGLWLREDGMDTGLGFASMQERQLKGTTGWTEYSVTLPLHPEARKLVFGFVVGGTGRGWVDDLQLLVDGKPVWEAPKVEPALTVLDRDHEFDAGSKVSLTALTPVQKGNLFTLGRVWGFLKYHHPKVMAGQLHWDYELCRILPGILAAPDRAAANACLVRWIDALGEIVPGTARTPLKAGDHALRPELAWIGDQVELGAELSQRLGKIYANPPTGLRQFYVSTVPGVANPVFQNELSYGRIKAPDAGFQLLALYRYWNIIRYWYPYRDLIGEDWDAVLAEYIPRVALAPSADAYQLEMLTLIARIHDTHANLWSSLAVRPPTGSSQLPVTVRFIENHATVTGLLDAGETSGSGLQVGDIIEAVDGRTVARLVEEWTPFYAASNDPTRLRDIAQSLTKGPAGEVKLDIRRGAETRQISAARVPIASLVATIPRTHDRPGETFQLLSRDVAYLKLSSVKLADTVSYITRAAGTKGLVVDLRNYPSAFIVLLLGAHLIDRPTDFASFAKCDLANPGAFHFTPPFGLQPQPPFYAGKVVILVDEVSQSQAEYTAMAFRTAPHALVIGSTTAGADGDLSRLPLPGGLATSISGNGIFYPDRRPTQRIGIIPDIESKPTIDGIKAGRDEVLEEALRQVLGPDASAEEIRKLAKPAE